MTTCACLSPPFCVPLLDPPHDTMSSDVLVAYTKRARRRPEQL